MLGRACLFALIASGVFAACGGAGFEPHQPDDNAGAGGAPDVVPSGGSGGDRAGTGQAGTLTPGGAPTEGGAGGSPATPPSIAVVQASRTSIVSNMDPSLTLTTPPHPGNALIVGITCFSDLDNCVIPEGGVTDNQNNSYALVIEGASIVSSDTHGSRGYLFIASILQPPSGAFTITVNPNGMAPDNVQNFAWGVIEVAGLAAGNPVDQVGTVPNSCCEPSTTVTTDGPTSQANELAVAVHTARSNDNDFDYGYEVGWTQQQVNGDGVSQASQHSLVTRVLSEPGIVSHTWTHHEPSRGVSAIIATFRGATD